MRISCFWETVGAWSWYTGDGGVAHKHTLQLVECPGRESASFSVLLNMYSSRGLANSGFWGPECVLHPDPTPSPLTPSPSSQSNQSPSTSESLLSLVPVDFLNALKGYPLPVKTSWKLLACFSYGKKCSPQFFSWRWISDYLGPVGGQFKSCQGEVSNNFEHYPKTKRFDWFPVGKSREGGREQSLTTICEKKLGDFVKLELSIKPRDSDSKNGSDSHPVTLMWTSLSGPAPVSLYKPTGGSCLAGSHWGLSLSLSLSLSHTHTHTHTCLLCEWDLMLMELPLLYLQPHLCPNRQAHVSNCRHLRLDVPTASTSAVGSELTSPQAWALLSPLCNGITTPASTWYLLPHPHPISCQVLLSLCLAWFSCRFLNRLEGISPGFL